MTTDQRKAFGACVRCNDNRAGFCGKCMEKQSYARVQAATAVEREARECPHCLCPLTECEQEAAAIRKRGEG